jgi:hypothetical protein
VNELARIVMTAGGRNVEGPRYEGEIRCVVFFEDPCGNRFEIAIVQQIEELKETYANNPAF